MQKPLTAPLLASLLMTLACASAQAQGVYRIVGPDGKVTFSDRPPADASSAQPARAATEAAGAANGELPYALRQVANRFPVTLYTGSDCTPCTSARNLLTSRGIPFTERTVSSNEDIAALQRLSGASSLPFGTRLKVTHGSRSVVVTVNDRGPFIRGRVLDLSKGAAQVISLTGRGVGHVVAEVQ